MMTSVLKQEDSIMAQVQFFASGESDVVSTTTTTETTSNTSALSVLVSEIADFLDVTSIVRLSRTCSALHDRLVVQHDRYGFGKIKVPRFSLSDPSFTTLSSATQALSSFHFPSLRKLEFKMTDRRQSASDLDSVQLRNAFLFLAHQGLAEASNLEELHVHLGLIMAHEGFFRSMRTHEALGKNLAERCTKLRRIKVFNQAPAGGGRPSYYSADFLAGLLPLLLRNDNGGAAAEVAPLEEITLLIGNSPLLAPPNAASMRLVFMAILRLPSLRDFNLELDLASSPLLNNFLEAAECVRRNSAGGTLPSLKSIERFSLMSVLYNVPEGVPNPLPATRTLEPILSLLGNETCPNLHSFVVRVPPSCWNSGAVLALGKILSKNAANLRTLALYFHGYQCNSGKCFNILSDYIRKRERMGVSDNHISVMGLERSEDNSNDDAIDIDDDAEDELERYHHVGGKKCMESDDGYGGMIFKAKGRIVRW